MMEQDSVDENALNVSGEIQLPEIYPEDDRAEDMPTMRAEIVYPKPAYSISLMTKEDSREVSLTSTANDTESDEQHLDAQSDISDTFSVASSIRSFKKHDYKKLVTMVTKLKQDNFALTEALDHARASDIAMLKTKLRGAHADMMRLKQNNAELKERIQVLEDKLFKILSDQVDNKEDDDSSNAALTGAASISDVIRQKMKQKQSSQVQLGVNTVDQQRSKEDDPSTTSPEMIESIVIPPLGGNNRLTNSVKASYVALQNRCKYLENLRISYEKTMQMLQDEVQQAKQNSIHVKEEKSGKSVNFSINNSITSSSSQDKVVVSNGADSNKATPVRLTASTQVVLQQAIDEARAADQKTIQELAKEVKRLTSLLPRQLIDEAEEEENNNTKESNKMEASEQVESSELDGDENSKSLNIITADDDGVVETEIGQRKQVSETEEASLKLVKGGESFCYKLLKIVTFTAIALLVLFIVILKFVA